MTSYARQSIAAAVLSVSFVAARSTYAQDATNIADQVTIFPVPPGLHFQRAVFGACFALALSLQ